MINLTQIAARIIPAFSAAHSKIKGSDDYLIVQAMNEACKQVLDLAADQALVESYYEGNTGSEYQDFRVKRDSILQVKNLIT